MTMAQLVRLRIRPSRDGRSFKYGLDFVDENGKRQRVSLGHANKRKAEKQRDQKEQQLQMGIVEPGSMRLSAFARDSMERSRGQVRDSTLTEIGIAIRHFIDCVGNIDYQAIRHGHGEKFVQYCLDMGNAAGTASKKLRHIKRLFQLARERGQLDDNPLRWVKQPKGSKKKVHVYTDQQSSRLIKAALQYQQKRRYIEWELLVRMALCTAMRRGELLNLTWRDVDFERMVVDVAPKDDTEDTWQWHIKDADRRTLPLTEGVTSMLAELQARQPEGYPYVFIPTRRYERIQRRRREGNWSVEAGRCPVNNFNQTFASIRLMAGIKKGTFHDLRRTCLTNWLATGLSEFEVMNLAGHSKFETTRRFYLAVNDGLVGRARAASESSPMSSFGTRLARAPVFGQNAKGPTSINTCQP